VATTPEPAVRRGGTSNERTDRPHPWLDGAIDHAIDRITRLRDAATGFPVATQSGRWRFNQEATWTAGFWPGRLWIAYLLTGQGQHADAARSWCAKIASHQLDTSTHDLGMMFGPSFVMGWNITGDEAYRHGALAAASTLARRYHPRGRFLRALGQLDDPERAGYTIVDTLMNLSLLFWASDETGEGRYFDIARSHAQTSRRHHVRPDGSTYQVFDFDPATGASIGPSHYQGHSVESCWSRGQAWAIYGMAMVARWTGDTEDMQTACRVADWWLAQVPADGVPAWDFAFGDQDDEPRDSSAAAIAACGLLDLSEMTGSMAYRETAIHTGSMLARRYTSAPDPVEEGILLHGTWIKPLGRDVDVSMTFGDYFYVELLLRLARPQEFAQYTPTRSHR
jgi:unsaturated chondroitin disaccharide hydrolase